jgi:hypothetical protein
MVRLIPDDYSSLVFTVAIICVAGVAAYAVASFCHAAIDALTKAIPA